MPAPRLIDAALGVEAAVRALFPSPRHDTPRVADLRAAVAGVRRAALGEALGDTVRDASPLAVLELALAHCRELGVASEKIIAATTRAVHGRAEPSAPAPAAATGKDAAAGEGLE